MRAKLVAAILLACAGGALAQSSTVEWKPADIKFGPVPFAAGVEAAWLAGGPDKGELYTLRVRLQNDAKIPPHTHPDTRMVTVLSGELFAASGAKPDFANAVAWPEGSMFVVPANLPHLVWAKNGPVLYQESGMGPSPTVLIKD